MVSKIETQIIIKLHLNNLKIIYYFLIKEALEYNLQIK